MVDDKSYIIDPLTSLCKVALLHFMEEGTKLAINHYVLYIQGNTYYQWIERTKNRDSRFDISNLNTPFLKAIKWYLLDGTEKIPMDEQMSESIKIITKYSILGLQKLQNYTYQEDISIKIILQYFINMLRNAINGNWTEENCVKPDISTNSVLADKIKYYIDPQTINSIAKMLMDAEKMSESEKDMKALIDCAHQLLINRDTNFVRLMKEVNTTL